MLILGETAHMYNSNKYIINATDTDMTRIWHTSMCTVTWNNGKSGAKLDLTSSTTPGLQIHTVNHIRTANLCDWLLCCHAALQLVGCPQSLVYLHLPVVEGLIFCISAIPHLGKPFPLFHDTGHLAWLGNAKYCRKLTLVSTSYPQLFVSRQFL